MAVVVERTLALIKPDAVHRTDDILDLAQSAGFVVLQKRRLQLSQEQASEFYAEHFGKTFFPNLISFMASGPIVAAVLSKENAVQAWRDFLGPTDSNKARASAPTSYDLCSCLCLWASIRARFGTDGTRNAAHGSDSLSSAHREARFFFPEGAAICEPLASSDVTRDYISKSINPTLLQGLTALCKARPADPITWLAAWLLANNPNKPVVVEPSD